MKRFKRPLKACVVLWLCAFFLPFLMPALTPPAAMAAPAVQAPPAAQTAPALRVVYGFDREFPPFSYEEAGGEPTGFEVDLVRAALKESNVVLDFRPLQWELIPIELSEGKINLTTGMIRTEQRSRLYLFSDKPTFPLQIRLFTKVYNRFPNATLLRGQMVGVEQGSYQHRLLEGFGGINIKTYNGRIDGLRALFNDEIVAFCGPMQNAYYYINKLNYGAVTTIGTPLGITEMRVAVNRDRGDILKAVNDGLARVIKNGEYNRLYRKWFVRDLTDEEIGVMMQAAHNASVPAYVPYGGDADGQGAAVLTATGKVYTACTVENADLSLSLSAMRNAVARAIGDGEFELRGAVLVDPKGTVLAPGPDDLQTLHEFGKGILLLSESAPKQYTQSMVMDLLPNPVVKDTPTIIAE